MCSSAVFSTSQLGNMFLCQGTDYLTRSQTNAQNRTNLWVIGMTFQCGKLDLIGSGENNNAGLVLPSIWLHSGYEQDRDQGYNSGNLIINPGRFLLCISKFIKRSTMSGTTYLSDICTQTLFTYNFAQYYHCVFTVHHVHVKNNLEKKTRKEKVNLKQVQSISSTLDSTLNTR